MPDINWLQDHLWAVPVLAASAILVIIVMVIIKVKSGGLLAVISAFFLAALILYFPYLHKVSVGILGAELQNRIQTADATIAQLREIATFSVKQTLLSYADSISDGAGARKRVFEQRDKGLQLLQGLHASKEQLADAVTLFNTMEAHLMVSAINADIGTLKIDPSKLDAYAQAFYKTFPDQYYNPPPAAELEEFARHYVTLTPELDDEFKDLAYFQANGELRRPKYFFSHHLPP